ncbi:MAG: DUF1275 family protein [Actinomadura sp.]
MAKSLLAVLAFTVGAALGGRLATERPPHRGHLIAMATAIQAVLVLITAVLASTTDVGHPAVRLNLIALLALAMGGQNAVVRRLAVPIIRRHLTLIGKAIPNNGMNDGRSSRWCAR